MRTPLVIAAAAALTLISGLPIAAAAPSGQTWTADLSAHNEDSNNIANAGGVVRLGGDPAHVSTDRLGERLGIVVFDPHQLSNPSNTVSASLDGSVPADSELAVDVRGLRADGQWTEWEEASSAGPAVLPVSTSTVQVRMTLTAPNGSAGPEARKLSLSASAAAKPMLKAPAARSYKVYATREGLVGGTTANGHKIKSHDHFVALPSGKALSAAGKTTYSVKVCAANGRCETAPVWDIGPWNTRDDYWNPSSVRQSWKNLAEGKPEAQAAYQNGYNGGKDQFGRKVSNPAGIDLADGTFLDGLRLADNSWVTVTYLWT